MTNSHPGFSENNVTELRTITSESCTCPGYVSVYECTVAGGGATILQGTALEECAGGRITLRHSQSRRVWTQNHSDMWCQLTRDHQTTRSQIHSLSHA